MYWSSSDKSHFFTFLPKNYRHQLKLSKKFVLRNEVPEICTLKGQSGLTWAVELIMKGDGEFYITQGWKEFVRDHNLKEGDGLFFEYKSDVLDVMMFDGGTSCEKESSYFVFENSQSCHHQRTRDESETMQSEEAETDSSIEIIEPRNRLPYREKSITISDDDDDEVEEEEEEADSRTLPLLLERASISYQQRFTKNNSKAIVGRTEDSEEEINQVQALVVAPARRTVLSKETHLPYIQAVCEGARRGTLHFVVLIQPSHVSRSFFMTIPAESARSYLPREHKDVSLKMDGKTWVVEFLYNGKGKSSGFSRSGWQDFVCKNNLEAGNACLFEHTSPSASSSSKSRNQLTFNVSIFRDLMQLQTVASSAATKRPVKKIPLKRHR